MTACRRSATSACLGHSTFLVSRGQHAEIVGGASMTRMPTRSTRSGLAKRPRSLASSAAGLGQSHRDASNRRGPDGWKHPLLTRRQALPCDEVPTCTPLDSTSTAERADRAPPELTPDERADARDAQGLAVRFRAILQVPTDAQRRPLEHSSPCPSPSPSRRVDLQLGGQEPGHRQRAKSSVVNGKAIVTVNLDDRRDASCSSARRSSKLTVKGVFAASRNGARNVTTRS